MDLLDRLIGHDYWATSLELGHCESLTEDELTEQFDIGLGFIHSTIIHQVLVIEFWTAQIEQRPADLNWDARPSIAELAVLHTRYHGNFAKIARAAQANGTLDQLFSDHHGNQQSVGGTILHILSHNQLHRAEVRHMLNRLGVDDVWDGDPQEWEYVLRETAGTRS